MTRRDIALHGGAVLGLAVLGLVLPEYHHGVLARVMVLAVFAMGYNIAFGYAGLLSLGHALFFAAGVYAAGLVVTQAGWPAWAGIALGPVAGGALACAIGLLALRTTGVSLMIVTLMFAQAGYLMTAYFGEITRADEGFVIAQALRQIGPLDLSASGNRYMVAWAALATIVALSLWLVRSRTGLVLMAIRQNAPRAEMLGYNTFRLRLLAFVLSGALAGLSGGLYALLFGYVGNTFASIQYSILPLLWVLLGGAGVVLGPIVGTLGMFYLVDIASSLTDAYLIAVGVALVLLVLFAPQGILGAVRARWARWLP